MLLTADKLYSYCALVTLRNPTTCFALMLDVLIFEAYKNCMHVLIPVLEHFDQPSCLGDLTFESGDDKHMCQVRPQPSFEVSFFFYLNIGQFVF